MLLSMMLKQSQRHSIKIEELPGHTTTNCCFKRDFPNGHSTLYPLCFVISQTTHFCSQTTIFRLKIYFTYKEKCYTF